MARKIEIDEHITIGALAAELLLPATQLIAELFKNGIMATVNEKIDFDTAQIVVGELGLEVELARKDQESTRAVRVRPPAGKSATARPPVVAVMGHVDHGKTSLLDAIRKADVASGEAGGITQHISAYQITHGGRAITFLDTPGHAAFAALREHGATLTDLAVIAVAADDGIKPQTLEAIRFARKAGVKMIVAATKADKPEADINRLKQQLSENDMMPEEWGGEIIVLPVSAKTGVGVEELLDMILLVADVEELKADYDCPATGLVVEAHMEQGRGPVAIALVEQGVLKPGQFIVAGSTYAKVRNLEAPGGDKLDNAGPSSPVIITGFKALPEFADEFRVVKDEKEARVLSTKGALTSSSSRGSVDMTGSELIRMINRSNQTQELNVIIKADVQGSLTSVIDSLKTLDTDEVAVRVVGSGVGDISENDLHLANGSGAIIYGFHVSLPASVRQHASRDKVEVVSYTIIYELIDDVKGRLQDLLVPKIVETPMGRLIVRGVFKTTKTEIICGGEVTKGNISLPSLVRVFRGNDSIAEDLEVIALRRGPQETKVVLEGEMCGLGLKTTSKVELLEGDRIEFFTRETIKRTL